MKIIEITESRSFNTEKDGIDLSVTIDDKQVKIIANAHGKELGYAEFDRNGSELVASELEVDERFRGQGIARVMYDYAKELDFSISRSPDQTPAGEAFWDKNVGPDEMRW